MSKILQNSLAALAAVLIMATTFIPVVSVPHAQAAVTVSVPLLA